MQSENPYLIITSDTHVSSSDGRWYEATAHFRSFLDSLKVNPPKIMFINGDIVDNVASDSNKNPVTETLLNWQKDVQEYLSAIETYKETEFHGSLGPGHDFSSDISMAYAGERVCSDKGSFCWQGFNFVWLSGKVASFSNDPELREESFDADDLVWLDNELSGKDNAVLLFHVPLRTDATFERGAWSGHRNITIPTEDAIYSIIDRHLDRIEMIFNGHIHGFIESEYKGIPIKIATFYNQGHHCKVYVRNEELNVTVDTYPPVSS